MVKYECITRNNPFGRDNGYATNIEKDTLSNEDFRKILYTSPYLMQLVLMTLKPKQDIGLEVHPKTDQFLRIETGEGMAILGNRKPFHVSDGWSLVVPAGTKHNIINTSEDKPLKLYTIYAPREH